MQVTKRWVADGSAVKLALGFVPEYVRCITDIDATSPDVIEWFKEMEDEDTAQYGVLCTGTTGVLTELTTAATGIKKLDEVNQGVLVPAPDGGDDQFRVPTEWAATTDYSSGYSARTASAAGSIVRPPTRNGRVFELKTATATAASAPSSWDVNVGEDVTDGGANVFTCREEKVANHGAQGIEIGATTQTDGDVNYLVAIKGDHYTNAGDAAEAGSSESI